jgi:hypothetical protein
MPFEGAVGRKLADFGSKSGGMILVVETTRPVCWMDPTQDIPQQLAEMRIKSNEGANGEINSEHPGGVIFGSRGGCAEFLSETTDVEVIKGLLRGTIEKVP